jgi:hypothetical protein
VEVPGRPAAPLRPDASAATSPENKPGPRSVSGSRLRPRAATLGHCRPMDADLGFSMTAWIQFIIAGLAIVISLFTLFYTRTKDRTDVFLRIHEQLIGDDGQKGRDLLRAATGPPSAFNEKDFQCIRRTLARFQVLGLYAQTGKVRKDDVMALLAPNLLQCHDASKQFVEFVEATERWTPWPQFLWLGDEAEKYLRANGSPLITWDSRPDWHAKVGTARRAGGGLSHRRPSRR